MTAGALDRATMRALAARPRLQMRGGGLYDGPHRLPRVAQPFALGGLPDGGHTVELRRAEADGLALRLLHGDAVSHHRHAPRRPVARWVYEMLEQLRVESLAAWPGVRHNLRVRFEQWAMACQRSGLTDTQHGLLLYTLAQMVRARLTGEPVVEATEGLIEATRMALAAAEGTALAVLRRERFDPAAHAVQAAALAERMADRLPPDAGVSRRARHGEPEGDAADDPLRRFALPLDGIDDPAGEGPLASDGREVGRAWDGDAGYRIHTTAYDVELPAATGIRRALLDGYRAQLDRDAVHHAAARRRFTRALQRLIGQPALDGWDGAQDEGRVDPRRLAQLVASPAERRVFRQPRPVPEPAAAFTLLIDCSGSMRAHAGAVAVLADGFARAVEDAGGRGEVLGYTTGAWQGGRARLDWERAGRPARPGRLAERCHLVFKGADTPWRRARHGLAALLKTDRHREGLDGEAVAWACDRLRALEARRRVLLVLSDGSPMDSATALANRDEGLLARHLQAVLDREAARGEVDVLGLGLGDRSDVASCHRDAVVLDLSEAGGRQAWREMLRLIAGPLQRR